MYDLVHAAMETLNRGSARGLDGCGPQIYQKFKASRVPRMLRITQDLEVEAVFTQKPNTLGLHVYTQKGSKRDA